MEHVGYRIASETPRMPYEEQNSTQNPILGDVLIRSFKHVDSTDKALIAQRSQDNHLEYWAPNWANGLKRTLHTIALSSWAQRWVQCDVGAICKIALPTGWYGSIHSVWTPDNRTHCSPVNLKHWTWGDRSIDHCSVGWPRYSRVPHIWKQDSLKSARNWQQLA